MMVSFLGQYSNFNVSVLVVHCSVHICFLSESGTNSILVSEFTGGEGSLSISIRQCAKSIQSCLSCLL